MDNGIMSRIVIVILIHHRYTHIDIVSQDKPLPRSRFEPNNFQMLSLRVFPSNQTARIIFDEVVEVNLRPTVCRPVCHGVWNLWSDFSFLSDNCGFLDVVHPLWREDGSVIYSYNCFWALPEQLLSGPSSAEPVTILYYLIWEAQPGWPGSCIYIPREQGGPVILLGTEFPFRRLLQLAGLRWRFSNPPPHGYYVWGYVSTKLSLYWRAQQLHSSFEGYSYLYNKKSSFFFSFSVVSLGIKSQFRFWFLNF
jgi:hypothetical protein